MAIVLVYLSRCIYELVVDKAKLAYATALAVGAGTAVLAVWWIWSRKQKPRPPSKWRKVGELSDLIIFPVKSLGSVRENSMECTQLGLKSGWLRDRTLVVIDTDGKFITARQKPKMVQVHFLKFFFTPNKTRSTRLQSGNFSSRHFRFESLIFRPEVTSFLG